MARSKTIRYVTLHEVDVGALATINQPPLPPTQSITKPRKMDPLYENLILAPRISIYVQVTPINPHVSPPVLQPEVFLGHQVLQANLKVQGTK